ncbi:hypothetical protein I6N90_10950 [Paenibacillus sp. GSMTC-2017]|uniref:hypothetical protein n=1 Tax=Paenibacillus sp. GSMTC-2017 TaxID=2794350 RepID=UPI0018D5F1B6|nr:hypothetical protein [Paenibacillus sp. GSMTC-2017]MBH5318326.1 hypothetical protein [Paenibacillus sp. GSMTC-2017]
MKIKSTYLMENGEVENPELMAYTISKLGSFEWNRTTMYNPNNIYDRPAGFYFRFHDKNEVYSQLETCINSFLGKLQWCINASNNTRHKNYIVEPMIVYEAKLSDEYSMSYNLESILGCSYVTVCEQAIEDNPLLCKHIEEWFDVRSKRPYFPTK